jgi:hypothetical protein
MLDRVHARFDGEPRRSLLMACVSATSPRACVASTITACCAGEKPISEGALKCAVRRAEIHALVE